MSLSETVETPDHRKRRIGWLDAGRGVALLAMASYHFSWDLEYFGYLEPGTAGHGLFKVYARCIATTFLFLAGFSLALGHRDHIRWDRFWVRFGKIAGAAILITVATWFAIPQGFIHFGILHEIALASLVGLAFLRMPAFVTWAVAIAVFALPQVWRSEIFDAPWFWWTGLGVKPQMSFDYVPVFPWLAAVLAGIGAGRIEPLVDWLRSHRHPGRFFRPFEWAGQKSLPIYLIHQIPLFGLVYLMSLVAPPDRDPAYLAECQSSCIASGSAELCQRFCACTLDTLKKDNMLEALMTGKITNDDERIQGLALQCSMDSQK